MITRITERHTSALDRNQRRRTLDAVIVAFQYGGVFFLGTLLCLGTVLYLGTFAGDRLGIVTPGIPL